MAGTESGPFPADVCCDLVHIDYVIVLGMIGRRRGFEMRLCISEMIIGRAG